MTTKRKELFEQWKCLGLKIESLSEFVQNDCKIPEHRIKEFRECAYSCWMELNELTGKTLDNIRTYNEEHNND
jgi:hypothetical protein